MGWPQAPSFAQRFGCSSASEDTGQFASHLANGVQNVQVFGMLGRSVGKAGRQEKQAGEMSSSVWTGCLSLSLKKNNVYFASAKCLCLNHLLSGTRQGTITPSFHLRPAQDSRPSRLQLRTKSQCSGDPNGHCSD